MEDRPEVEVRCHPFRIGRLRVTREMILLIALVLLAFVMRFALLPADSVINGDGIYYTILGERFVSGDISGGISAYWSPFYSLLTGISSLLFADRAFAGRFVSLIAGSLLLVPSYLLIRDLYGRRAAIIGSVFLVFDPSLIRASSWVMTESVYTLVFVGFILAGWKAFKSGALAMYFATGILLGMSFLLKPEAIAYVLLMLIPTVCVAFWTSTLQGSGLAIRYLTLVVGFSIFFLPYFLFIHSKTGIWTISQKVAINLPAADFNGELLKILNGEGKTMKDMIWGDDYGSPNPAPAFSTAAGDSQADSPGWIAATLVLSKKAKSQLMWQIRRYIPAIMPLAFLFVLIAGFFSKPWTRGRVSRDGYLLLFFLATLAGYSFSSVELRYLFPLIPILIAWVASGVVNLSEWARATAQALRPDSIDRLKPIYFQILATIVLLLSTTPMYYGYLAADTIQNIPFEEKRAGIWLHDHTEIRNPTVMSANITVAFYANANHVYLPDEDRSTTIKYARQRNASYLVLSSRRAKEVPSFGLDRNGGMAGLTEVYRDRQDPSHEITIYKVECSQPDTNILFRR